MEAAISGNAARYAASLKSYGTGSGKGGGAGAGRSSPCMGDGEGGAAASDIMTRRGGAAGGSGNGSDGAAACSAVRTAGRNIAPARAARSKLALTPPAPASTPCAAH